MTGEKKPNGASVSSGTDAERYDNDKIRHEKILPLRDLTELEFEIYKISHRLVMEYPGTWFRRLPRIARMKLNRDMFRISMAIESLIKKKYIIPNTRMSYDEILDNANRFRIYETIKHNPGIYFRKLLTKTSMENISALFRWHLSVLEKYGLIRSWNFKNKLCYFPEPFEALNQLKRIYPEIEWDEDLEQFVRNAYALLQDRPTRIIIGEFLDKGEKTLKEIAGTTKMDYDKIRYRVKILIENGIISRIRRDNKYFHRIRPDKEKIIGFIFISGDNY